MTDQTRQEIQRCQQHLVDPEFSDQAGARQGLEDWFWQSLFEDGLMSGLFQESGSTSDTRRAEADRLLKLIEELSEQLTTKEQSFVEQMTDSETVSPKQLFWLRDIKDRYL